MVFQNGKYRELFKNMTSFLTKPDLIIYLKASTDTLMSRINSRDRDFERNINPEYLYSLNISYDNWISGLKDIPVYVIESDDFNIFNEPNKLEQYCNQIGIEYSTSGWDITSANEICLLLYFLKYY